MLRIFNSLSRRIEELKPLKVGTVGMYACGPTVYDYSHIGHGRKYVNDDVLKRTLSVLEDLKVTHVQNITDVGHLVSDADTGEDKIEKGAKKYGVSVWEVARMYTDYFLLMADKLNIIRPNIQCKATDHIDEQIDLIKRLLEKDFAYETSEAVYFDTEKFKDYGGLFGQNLEEKVVGAREEVEKETSKKNPIDFVLWFKRMGKYADHIMYWTSPWGDGFPGWHIECSAMSMKYLGEQIDIHTGGEDHMSVHHPNEIAQSEAVTGKKPFVQIWMHTAFLTVDGKKMSKSLGNLYKIEDVEAKGFLPMALRYYYLTTHYRKTMNFSWDGLAGASSAWTKLNSLACSLGGESEGAGWSEEGEQYFKSFVNAMEDDLNTPQALAVVWEMMRSNMSDSAKRNLLAVFDAVLGLKLGETRQSKEISPEIQKLLEERERYRKQKNWVEADRIREEIESMGYKVEDKKE